MFEKIRFICWLVRVNLVMGFGGVKELKWSNVVLL